MFNDLIDEGEKDGEYCPDDEKGVKIRDISWFQKKQEQMKKSLVSESSKRNLSVLLSQGFSFQMDDSDNEDNYFVLKTPDTSSVLSSEIMINNIDEVSKLSKQKKIRGEEDNKKEESKKKKNESSTSTINAPVLDCMTAEQMEEELLKRGISSQYKPRLQQTLPKKKVVLDTKDVKTFLLTAIPKKYGTVKCYVKRSRKFGRLNPFPKYYLYLDRKNRSVHSKTDMFLVAARQRKKSKSTNIMFSLDESDLTRDSGNYFGKLRGNFYGTEFLLYDKGENEKSVDEFSTLSVREGLAYIEFTKNILGIKSVKKMKVVIPKLHESTGRSISFSGDSIMNNYKKDNWKDLIVLRNSTPQWSEEHQSYVLNFNGRVTKASVKNFQVVDPSKSSKILLQFGRVNKDTFVLDFRYPFSPIQAFGISLAGCTTKLMAE